MQQRHLLRLGYRLHQPVQIHLHQGLGKLRAGSQHLPLRVECQTAAIKHQLVIPAHRVTIHYRPLRFGRETGQHFAPHAFLAKIPRRCGHIHNHLRALLHQAIHRIRPIPWIGPERVVVPHILTNRQSQLAAIEDHRRIVCRRLEITILIKHIVGRQQRLRARSRHFPVLQQRHRIHRRPARLSFINAHVPHHQAHLAHRLRQLRQRRQIALDEPALEQQIARRITRDRQLRRHHQLRAGRHPTFIRRENQRKVPREIPHRSVNLRQPQFHQRFGKYV